MKALAAMLLPTRSAQSDDPQHARNVLFIMQLLVSCHNTCMLRSWHQLQPVEEEDDESAAAEVESDDGKAQI